MTHPNDDGPNQQEQEAERERERERPNYLDEWEKEKREVLRGARKSEKWEAAWGFESDFQERSEEQEGWLREVGFPRKSGHG
jgi:pterin-4a-carbinolamine dehydratase